MSVPVCAELAAKTALVEAPEPAAVSISRGLLPFQFHQLLGQSDAATLARSLGLFAVLTLGHVGHSAYALDLYDAARDKQAQGAKAAVSAIDTTAVINALQANHKALLAAELTAQDGYAATQRNLSLRELLGSKLREPLTRLGVLDLVEAEELKLIKAQNPSQLPDTTSAIRAYDNWVSAVRIFQHGVDALSPDFNRLGLGEPGCDGIGVAGDDPPPAFKRQMQAAGGIHSQDVTNLLRDIRNACQSPPPHVFDASTYGGAWAKAYAQYESAAMALDAVKTEAATAQKSYQKALDDYNKAVSENAAAGAPEASKAVGDAAMNLTKLVNVIGEGQNAFATQFIAQEKLTSLQNFLTAVLAGEDAATTPAAPAAPASAAAPAAPASATPLAAAAPAKAASVPAPADAASAPVQSKAALLIVGLSKLDDDTRKALAQAKIPLNVPLMLARDQEQLKLSAATVDVTAWQTQLDLSKQLLTTIADELRQLWLARAELTFESKDGKGSVNDKAKGKADSADSSIHMGRLANMRYDLALQEATPAEKNYLLTATVRYLDAVNRYSAQRDKLEYQRIAVGYDRSLAYSAVNVQRWQSLINVTTDQVADFYAAGFKPETIASLVQAASLLWIGHGVNK